MDLSAGGLPRCPDVAEWRKTSPWYKELEKAVGSPLNTYVEPQIIGALSAAIIALKKAFQETALNTRASTSSVLALVLLKTENYTRYQETACTGAPRPFENFWRNITIMRQANPPISPML